MTNANDERVSAKYGVVTGLDVNNISFYSLQSFGPHEQWWRSGEFETESAAQTEWDRLDAITRTVTIEVKKRRIVFVQMKLMTESK